MKLCKMTMLISLIFLSISCPTVFAADSGLCGADVEWTLSNGTMTISGSGIMEYPPDVTDLQREAIAEIVIEEGVSSICDYAFANCTSLEKAVIPESVREIGAGAFHSCEKLADVSLPNGLEYLGTGAFGFTAVTSITFGDSLENIPAGAYYSCEKLTSITIPDNIISIGREAFSGCSNVETVTIGENVTSVDREAFYGLTKLKTLYWNAKNARVATKTFYRAGMDTDEGLKAYFGDGVNTIPENIFHPEVERLDIMNNYSTPKLTYCSISSSVKTIGENAFRDCKYLKNITIPNGVTTIKEGAFSQTGLEAIFIPESVGEIERGAFHSNINLTTIEVDEQNERYCDIDGVLYNSSVTELIQYPVGNERTSFVLPETVTKVGALSFAHCSYIEEVTLPETLTKISDYAFFECTALTGMTIPETVCDIFPVAFYNCSSMTHINLPEKVTIIATSVFEGCSSLTEFIIHNKVTEIQEKAFRCCENLTEINIPNSVTVIGNSAFEYCTRVTKINIPQDITRIENETFAHCSKLKEITIPYGVEEIGERAFNYSSSLRTITLPSTIKTIETDAFEGTGLRYVLYKGTTSRWTEMTIEYEEKLSNATKYCNYIEGTPIAGLFIYDDYIFVDAINIEDTENAVVNLIFYDENDKIAGISANREFPGILGFRYTSFPFKLTKGKVTAMIWENETLKPLGNKTTRNYEFESGGNIEIGTEDNSGTGGGASTGGTVTGGVIAGATMGTVGG